MRACTAFDAPPISWATKRVPGVTRLSPRVSSVNSLWRRFQETCGDSPAFRKQPWSRSGFRVLIAAAARRGGGWREGGRRTRSAGFLPSCLFPCSLLPPLPFLRSSEAPTRSTCIGLDRIGEERGGRDCAHSLTYSVSQPQAHPSFDSRFARGRHSPRSLCRSFKTFPLAASIRFRGNRSTWMENGSQCIGV